MASVYCVECQMKLCHSCKRAHRGIKSTRSHKVVELGEQTSVEILCQSMPPSYCDQHKDENLKLYCFDCKAAICVMCYIELHNSHKCSDVNKVGDDFRKIMASDVDNVAAGVEKCREMLESLEKEKNHLSEAVTKTGIEINEKAQQLKRMIEVHKEKLMNELLSMKQKRMKEIERLRVYVRK